MASKSRIRYRDFVSVPIKQLQELHLLILYFDTSGREDVMRMVFEGEVMRFHTMSWTPFPPFLSFPYDSN